MDDQFCVSLQHNLPVSASHPIRLLSAARKSGLPVPDSFLLPDEAYQAALQHGLIHRQTDHTLACPEPEALAAFLHLPTLPQSLNIRLPFAKPLATDSQQIGRALCEIWASEAERRDVLVMPKIETQHTGTAFTETDFENDYMIESIGQEIPRWRFWERAAENTFITRLQKLLRRIRRVFGAKNWEIEWADDGRICWLMQIRSMTTPSERNETFVAYKHMLPPFPSLLMTGLIAASADDIYRYCRQLDRSLPKNRKLIEIFQGRPYLNLSLYNETRRRLGLDASVLGRISKIGALARLGFQMLRTVQSSQQMIQQIRAATPGESLSEGVEHVRWLYILLTRGELALSMILPLFKGMEAYSEPTLSTAIYTDLAPLRELAGRQDEVRLALAQGKLPKNKKFLELWDSYLEKHGHRGIYETDIAQPRYRENPRPLLDSLLTSHQMQHDLSPPRSQWARFLWAAIHAQENLRYEVMKGLEQSRAHLLRLAAARLPDPNLLWMLTPEEVAQLETGWQPDETFFQSRRADIERHQRYELPAQFRRFDDFTGTMEEKHLLHGISLNHGRVRGVAWVLDEPDTRLPEDFDEDSTILVTWAVDAGWIPTFSRVAGVVVETGNGFSQEAILLRGIGIPAITHVEGATHQIHTGDEVVLRADQGIVERV